MPMTYTELLKQSVPAGGYLFYGDEDYLKNQLEESEDKTKILSLLAHLYHHRMTADSRRVSHLAREAIMRNPEKKDCQWLLQKAEGAHSK